MTEAIGQVRSNLVARARTFQRCVEGHAARGGHLRRAHCWGQLIASGEAASYIDEAIVAAFDLWDQYQAQVAAQTPATGGQAAAAVASPARSRRPHLPDSLRPRRPRPA